MALDRVPDELIQQLISYISPLDNLASLQVLSRRLHRLANEPLLWRQYCQTAFRNWSKEHGFERLLQAGALDVDWKALFVLRLSRNRQAAQYLDSIVNSRIDRLKKIEQICLFGYDVKDFLVQQCRVGDDAEDALARR
jgi:F-box protein 21